MRLSIDSRVTLSNFRTFETLNGMHEFEGIRFDLVSETRTTEKSDNFRGSAPNF